MKRSEIALKRINSFLIVGMSPESRCLFGPAVHYIEVLKGSIAPCWKNTFTPLYSTLYPLLQYFRVPHNKIMITMRLEENEI